MLLKEALFRGKRIFDDGGGAPRARRGSLRSFRLFGRLCSRKRFADPRLSPPTPEDAMEETEESLRVEAEKRAPGAAPTFE
jgi:hypothetical protein